MEMPFNSAPPAVYTQDGGNGIRYDFNDGARVSLPAGSWHVQIIDGDSGNILYECNSSGGWVASSKKYYVPFVIRVTDKDGNIVFNHKMSLKDKDVLIKFPIGTLGDMIAWLPYVDKFQRRHDCRVECTVGQDIKDLFAKQYKNIIFSVPPESQIVEPYATYKVGLFWGKTAGDWQPYDFRQVGLHRTAAYILGVDASENAPKLPTRLPKQIKDKYVCIATKASTQTKMWNNPDGWRDVVDYLKSKGYRVLCIDKERREGRGNVWNEFPEGAEDFTGNRPLLERAALLRHADFFIGLPSGLSWLAWAAGCPVVMIAGFSLPLCEFYTPYRVQNTHVCIGCWDDTALHFDKGNYFWCPRHKNFECTSKITSQQVINTVQMVIRDVQQGKKMKKV